MSVRFVEEHEYPAELVQEKRDSELAVVEAWHLVGLFWTMSVHAVNNVLTRLGGGTRLPGWARDHPALVASAGAATDSPCCAS